MLDEEKFDGDDKNVHDACEDEVLGDGRKH